MNVAIWWIRRDLRLEDNQALTAALNEAQQVVPVFIVDPVLLVSPYLGEKRLAFLFLSLRQLDASLQARGSRLLIRRGDALQELMRLVAESRAEAVFAEPDYSPYAQRRDRRVAIQLPVRWSGSPAIYPPGSVLKNSGEPFVIYTPFSKAWKALPAPGIGAKFNAPARIPTPDGLNSLPIPGTPALSSSVPFPPGEAEAQRRLQAFMRRGERAIYGYCEGRDRLDREGTSGLSPYLRFGMLSARQAAAAAQQAIQNSVDAEDRQNAETWLNELIWRDFYMHILYHFPRVRSENFRLPRIAWENSPQSFAAWREGRTGYPVVDAAMRQLVEIGWMHNRARMIVASFLTKDLLIDWRWGERWFMQHLVDGDPAANNGGWQWSAGTGTDAAPYFRIFNPVSQSKKHDPQGNYIRLWLTELRDVPDEYIHEPWKMPVEVQNCANCRIGKDYPPPMVDHARARERALKIYGQAR